MGAALVGLMTACSGSAPEPRSDLLTIAAYEVVSPSELRLYLDWCGNGAQADKEESGQSVYIVVRPGRAEEGDCQATALLSLNKPLRDRVVIDQATGNEVSPSP